MSATKREEVCSHLRYIRLELREMHQMLIKEDLLPDLNEAKEVHAQLDALLDLLSEKKVKNIKRTNFAEFFVWPNSLFFLFELALIFLEFFFFMNHITLLHC